MVYENFKDLPKRTTSHKALCDKAVNIAKNSKYGGYQWGITAIIYNVLIKSLLLLKNELIPNQCPSELATKLLVEQFYTQIIRTFERWKV